MKKKCIIVDIDGTLANIDHRRKDFLNDNDWKAINSKINLDSINFWCKELIDSLKNKYKIILVTGRKVEFRDITLKWLNENEVSYSEIFFRENNDYRDDTVIKKEIYKKNIMPNYIPLFVVDDRSKVVTMWRDLGLVCLQCDLGDF
tara:strand:- start:251 stop:688 length:438 start_codon:yes stop_codon:yes gene_type:complete